MAVIAHGFKRAESESVRVVITETTTFDVSLEVGNIEQTVIVTSDSLVPTSGPQLGHVVDSRASRITSTSNNPRLIQFGLKLNF